MFTPLMARQQEISHELPEYFIYKYFPRQNTERQKLSAVTVSNVCKSSKEGWRGGGRDRGARRSKLETSNAKMNPSPPPALAPAKAVCLLGEKFKPDFHCEHNSSINKLCCRYLTRASAAWLKTQKDFILRIRGPGTRPVSDVLQRSK